MRGGNDDAAFLKMAAHLNVQLLQRCRVEPDAWLVEKPDRPFDGCKPRQAQPPLLPRRQHAGRKMCKRTKPERLKASRRLSPAKKGRPEHEVLQNRKSRAQRQPMTDEMGLLPNGQIALAALERD